jgi:hypothetical protein
MFYLSQKFSKFFLIFDCGVQAKFSSSLKKAGAKNNVPAKPGDWSHPPEGFLKLHARTRSASWRFGDGWLLHDLCE